MEKILLKDIVNSIDGKILAKGNVKEFSNVVIDSRKVSIGDIFFAIKGENFDAHNFIENVIENGAGLCIVHDMKDYSKYDGRCNVVLVKDTKKALLDLAAFYISTLNLKVIGITGSTGKTSTKDLIAAALSEKYKVFKTKGNFNNDIGMPLMIFNLDSTYEVAVLEMGMSNLKEIEVLAKTAKPDIAVITNVGTSHLENLKTRENILKAKLEITTDFNKNNVLIVNGDNDLLHGCSSEKYKIVKIGIEHDYNFTGCGIIINRDNVEFEVKEEKDKEAHSLKVPVPGIHNVLNSLLAVAVARELKVSYEDIQKGIMNLEATSMRLDVIKEDKFTIINDSYNASPDSMKAALEVLKTYEGRKIAVLGTMKELGSSSSKAHEEVGAYAKSSGVEKIFTIGEYNDEFKKGFEDKNCSCYDHMDELIIDLKKEIKENDVILIKASRSMKFENIVKELQRKNN